MKRDAVEKLGGGRRPERGVLLMTTTTAEDLREECSATLCRVRPRGDRRSDG